MKNEIAIRLIFFFGFLVILVIGELVAPRRKLNSPKSLRWFNNMFITAFNSVLLRVVFPVLPVGLALLAEGREWGLLHHVLLPKWLALVVTILVLDFVIWFQHVIFHRIPVLWRLHMMHHTDLDIDLTTGVRFHPIEAVLSMVIKLVVVYALGPPAVAVLIFEIILSVLPMFNHSNLHIPYQIDRVLRLVLVTPDMHRVHHSVVPYETNSNFGFNFSWWDRLMGRYRAQPEKGHIDMTIGHSLYRDHRKLNLLRLLVIPFVGRPGDYPGKCIRR